MKRLKIAAFIVFGSASILFTKDIFVEVMEGITDYHVTHQDVTPSDNPAVIICFDLRVSSLDVGPDIIFNVEQSTGNQTKKVDLQITKLETELYEIHVEFAWSRHTCFKLEPTKGNLNDSITRVEVRFTNEKGYSLESYAASVFFTTEENAPGAILYKFYDGIVERLEIWPGQHYQFRISKVTEYNLLSHKCTQQTFYECLASLLEASQECSHLGGLCSIVTLPGLKLPDCTIETYNCSSQFFWDFFRNSKCRSENGQLCQVMTYDLEYGDYRDDTECLDIYENSTYSFDFSLPPPISSRGDRLTKSYKTVKTEYYVWSLLSVTANIGGILSMTIQFSFVSGLKFVSGKMKKVSPSGLQAITNQN